MQPRKRMRRYDAPGCHRFLTFSCRHRQPLFESPWLRDRFAVQLEALRTDGSIQLTAWVLMPNHVHLLLRPTDLAPRIGPTLQKLKRRFREDVDLALDLGILDRSQLPRHRSGGIAFWQPGGGFDANILTTFGILIRTNYIHENPVRRGLVARPTDWPWSSARWYAGDRSGPVGIDEIATW
ncbi:MAG: transposase [Phycisphaerales bacterium]|nr:transposase [Phycisphaerales bacterium]